VVIPLPEQEKRYLVKLFKPRNTNVEYVMESWLNSPEAINWRILKQESPEPNTIRLTLIRKELYQV